MAQGSGGKRKRGDRSYSQDNLNEASRPSPHRPDALRLAQHNQSNYAHHNYNRDSPGRGGRRGGRGGRQPNSPRSPRPQQQQQRAPSSTSNPLPSPASTAPPKVSQPVENEAKRSPATNSTAMQTAREKEVPLDYDYVDFTQSVVSAWDQSQKQSIVRKARSAKEASNLQGLQRIYQETLRSGLDERIPVLEAADIIAQIVNDVGTEATEPALDTVSAEDFLDVVAISHLYEAHHPHLQTILLNCGIPLDLIRHILDDSTLEDLKLVRTSFAQTAIRHGTNVLYRMKVYNLLKEETEGYSKLVTELFTTSGNEPPTPDVINALLTRIGAMIGTFNLDVGRAFDITLDVFAAVLVKQNRFFLKYLRSSFWWPSNLVQEPHGGASLSLPSLPKWAEPDIHGLKAMSEEEKVDLANARRSRDKAFWKRVKEIGTKAYFELNGQRASQDFLSNLPTVSKDVKAFFEEWINSTGTLPPLGNKTAAQILGFKLRFYESRARDEDDTLPANLIYLAALLIKVGFISLFDLYPHLWPTDEAMNAVKEQKQKEKIEKDLARRPGGGMNALTRAGALPDDTIPSQSRRPADTSVPSAAAAPELKDEKSARQATNSSGDKSDLPEPADQKIQLLRSLLCIGALPEALYMLGRFPWLPELVPDIPDHIHRILHHSIGPVYEPLRPLKDLGSLQEPAKIVDIDELSTQDGDLKLIDQPPRKVLRWAQLDRVDASEGIDYKFYWEDWVDNIPTCHDIDEIFLLCDTLLNFSALKIGRDPTLLAKLARIGIYSLEVDSSAANNTRWFDLCKRLLVPALSFADCNSGIVSEVWALLKRFSIAKRYNVYSEWYQGQTSRNADLVVAFDMVKSRTKDLLKRISKTNTKQMARALAKATVASPGKVFEVALNQVESYDNLVDVVVEASRYFTEMAYDILTWSLVNALGKQRSRVQEDGMLTSKWLSSLGRFSGSVFKRYNTMSATPVIQYVIHQLQAGNSADLVVLTDLIKSMSGIISDITFNDAQVMAMTGGPVLRYEILQLLQDQRNIPSMKTSARRLMRALTDPKMVGPLLVALSQERQACVYRYEAPNGGVPPLKLLGNLFDEIHKVLVQYVDLLHTHLNQEDFIALVPSIAELIGDFGIEPNIAFWIWRPYIAGEIVQYDRSATSEKILTTKSPSTNQDGSTELESKANEDTVMVDSQPQGNGAKKDEQTLDEQQNREGLTAKHTPAFGSQASEVTEPAYVWHPVSLNIMDTLRPVLPPSTFTSLTEAFYFLFWRLSPYDMHIPDAYQDECRKLITKIEASKKERNDPRAPSAKQKEQSQQREDNRRTWTELHSKISTEHKDHLAAHLRTRASLLKEKDYWFERGSGYEDLSIALLEHCFVPRMLLSSVDAFFVFKVFKFLHAQGTKNFKTIGIIDTLFNHKRLVSIFFMCTAKEAEHIGRFLNEILKDLAKWHSSAEVFEKEAHGPKKDLFGFFVRGSLLNYENFRTILSKWHSNLHDALKTCFSSDEYMHIRNAVIVLKAVVPTFPAISWIGESLVKHVTDISERDARSDLKLAALSLLGNVKRHSKQWVSKQEFALNKPAVNGSSTPKPATTRSKTPQPEIRNTAKSLNAKAPEFVPSGPSSLNSSKSATGSRLDGQEDGEIKDGATDKQLTGPADDRKGLAKDKDNLPEKGINATSAANKVNVEVKESTLARQPSPKPKPSNLPAESEQRLPPTLPAASKLRSEVAKPPSDVPPANRVSHGLPDRPEATHPSRIAGQRQNDRINERHPHDYLDNRDTSYRRHERPPVVGRESAGERTGSQRGYERQEKTYNNDRDKRDIPWSVDAQPANRSQDTRHAQQVRDTRPQLREERSDRNIRDRPYAEQRIYRAEGDNHASKAKDDTMAPPRSTAVIPSDRGLGTQASQEQNRNYQYKPDERWLDSSRHPDVHTHTSSHRSSRTSSPSRQHDDRPRSDHHVHRDERVATDNRRYGESNTSHRYDDSRLPTGPRTDRLGELGHPAQGDRLRDSHRSFTNPGPLETNPGRASQEFGRSRQPQESQYGRLNQDPPVGPRLPNGTHAPPARNTRNASAPQPAPETRQPQQPPLAPVPSTPERSTPTGPASGRGPLRNQATANRPPPISTTIPPASVSESPDTAGVHPDRLRAIQSSGLGSTPLAAKPTMAVETPPMGPRVSLNPPKQDVNPPNRPTGPPMNSNDRNRGDKRFAGINNVLSQTGSPVTQDRNNQGTSIRGRHARNEAASSSPINNGPPRRDFPTPTDTKPPARQDLFANRTVGANTGPAPRESDGAYGRDSMRPNDRKPLPRPRDARSRSPRRDSGAPPPRMRDDLRPPRQEEQRDFRVQNRQAMPPTSQSVDRDRRGGSGGGPRENAGPSGPRLDHERRGDWGGERGGHERRERPERRNTGLEDGGSGRKRGRGPEEPYDQGRQMGHDHYQKRPRRGGPA